MACVVCPALALHSMPWPKCYEVGLVTTAASRSHACCAIDFGGPTLDGEYMSPVLRCKQNLGRNAESGRRAAPFLSSLTATSSGSRVR